MLFIVQSILYFIAVLFLIGSIYFSFKRRRGTSQMEQGLAASKMNICMGLMLVTLGIMQLFITIQTWVNFTVGIVFALLGLFNLFAGIRNHSIYRKNMSK